MGGEVRFDDPMKHIRNFCIIAHIDHGKSTLADRLLEMTGAVPEREMTKQVLDDMELEQERGITIKLHAIQLKHKARDGQDYILNLIDTPGHVDFTYEVSRSLAACEGAILVVDATQGVEAQTISNLYLAIDAGLEIIPFINKIDLPSAKTMLETAKHQVMELLGCKEDEILLGSAKSGVGTAEILEAVVHRVPPPKGDPDAPLRALIFDSVFDEYRGAVAYVRVFDGRVQEKDRIRFFSTGKEFQAEELGILEMHRKRAGELRSGDVGYLIAGIKDVHETKVGDTIMLAENPAEEPLPGYKEVKPMVFSGVYPSNSDAFAELRDALEKLKLNDAALQFEPESSVALGFGFRCGFLGLLHMEIIRERLEREYGQSLINTVPNVEYRVTKTDQGVVLVDNPATMPPAGSIEKVEEPFVKAQIISPTEYIGGIMKLCMERRGVHRNTTYLSPERADVHFELPLSEIIFDFYDKLKSMSRGYASLDYDFLEYRAGDLEADAAYYRIHFGATLRNPERLEQLVRSLRANFTPDGILKAREIEERLMNETWRSSEYDLFPKLARLRVPALLIHGEHDLVPVECARRIAEAIPGARFVLLGGSGHFCYLEAPDAVRKAIVEFLA